MRTLNRIIYVPGQTNRVTLYPITDTHIGARACDETLLKRDIARIADDPFAYWFHLGDMVDCVSRTGDKRFQESIQADWTHGEDDIIAAQCDHAIEMFKPIADKCLGYGQGNHEAAALRYNNRDVYKYLLRDMARNANVEPESIALGVQSFISIQFRRGTPQSYRNTWRLNIYVFHGSGGGALPGGHALALGRVLGNFDCDIALMGHRHVRQYVDKLVTGPVRNGETVQRFRAAMFVASYLDAWVRPGNSRVPIDTYVDHVGLPPLPLGTTPIIVYPDDKSFDFVIGTGNTVEQIAQSVSDESEESA